MQEVLNSITAIKKGCIVLCTGAIVTEEMTYLSQVPEGKVIEFWIYSVYGKFYLKLVKLRESRP